MMSSSKNSETSGADLIAQQFAGKALELAERENTLLTDVSQEYKSKIGRQKVKIAKLKNKIADLKARPAAG